MQRFSFFAILATTFLGSAADALANDADKAACEGLAEGTECIHHTGDPGICIPDASDPSVLTCDDDPAAGGSTGGATGGSCDGLGEGDACVRTDGSAGTCVPDVSDPGKLECEDQGGSDDGGNASGGDADGCADLSEGDACVRTDGRDGVCKPDDSDPAELECDDDTSPSGNDDTNGDDDTSLSCSVDPQRPLAGMAALLVLAGLGLRRRRAAR